MLTRKPIGIFDSGLGGLSVAEEVFKQLPGIPIVYFGDTARAPYGDRAAEKLITFADEITSFLIGKGCEIIIDACNSTSAVALAYLQSKYKNPIIGVIEPGIKSALEVTYNKKVGLIATEATIKSGAHKKVVAGMAVNIEIFPLACPEFVPLIEKGQVSGSEVDALVRRVMEPLSGTGIDTLILGCTHYPYLMSSISQVMGDEVAIVNPAARTVKDLKEEYFAGPLYPIIGLDDEYYVSGDVDSFKNIAEGLIGIKLPYVQQVIL